MVHVKGPYYKEDKEIEGELLSTELSQAMFQRMITKPTLVRQFVTPAEFRMLRDEIRTIFQTLRIHETALSSIHERVLTLESQTRKNEVPAKIESNSIENIKHLRELFELPKIAEEGKEDILTNMKGMLKGKSKEKIDSVELLHLIRGE